MARQAQDILKSVIGDLTVQVAILQGQVESLQEELVRAERVAKDVDDRKSDKRV